MMGIVEGLPFSVITLMVGTLGVPGAVMVLFYLHVQHTNRILAAYRDDVQKISRYYEDNVKLVKDYGGLADDLSGIIHLNTQAMTQLVEQIKNNMFCPVIREKGPHR